MFAEESFRYFTKILIQISLDNLIVTGVKIINVPIMLAKDMFKESPRNTLAIINEATAIATVKA